MIIIPTLLILLRFFFVNSSSFIFSVRRGKRAGGGQCCGYWFSCLPCKYANQSGLQGREEMTRKCWRPGDRIWKCCTPHNTLIKTPGQKQQGPLLRWFGPTVRPSVRLSVRTKTGASRRAHLIDWAKRTPRRSSLSHSKCKQSARRKLRTAYIKSGPGEKGLFGAGRTL